MAVGTLAPPGPTLPMPHRMQKLQSSVEMLFDELLLCPGDVLVCEGPAPLVKNPQSALKVEGVRGLFETLARGRGLEVPGRVNPRTVQSELLGMKGKQLPRIQVKEWARATAMQLFGEELKEITNGKISQDIIDAVLIGSFLLARLKIAEKTGMALEQAILPQSSGRGYQGRKRGSGWGAGDLKSLVLSRR